MFAPAEGKIATRVVPGVNDTEANRQVMAGFSDSAIRVFKRFLNNNNHGSKVLYFSGLVAGLLQMQLLGRAKRATRRWSDI